MTKQRYGVFSRAAAMIISSVLAFGAAPYSAAAQEQSVDISALLEDNDTLFAEYADHVFRPTTSGKLPQKSGRMQLDTATQVIYDELFERIVNVANGSETKTEFNFNVSQLSDKYNISASDLTNFDLRGLLNALLSDYPYELYWFDKTSSVKTTTSFYSINIRFCVSADYSKMGIPGTTETDSKKTSATTYAAARAAQIVSDVDPNWSDYQTLTYFKNKICELTSYNDYAAENAESVNYGNPWQMIYVFDDDPDTKVVCEGYSKAFKYLCDRYTFNSEVECNIITGQMTTSSVSGGHMWNMVSIGDKNYLVDVTNSESSSIGYKGELFMAGVPESNRLYSTDDIFMGVRIKTSSTNVTYVYDSSTIETYTTPELDVAYEAPMLHTVIWKTMNGDILETDELVADGEHPVYNGTTSVTVWNPDVSSETVIKSKEEEIVYTALNSEENESNTVSYIMPDGTHYLDVKASNGTLVEEPKIPMLDECTFVGWYSDENFTNKFAFMEPIKADTMVYAKFVCDVSWIDYDGSILYQDRQALYGTIPEYLGSEPTRADDEQHSYIFNGWSPEPSALTGNVEYTAQYLVSEKKYTVTWLSEDGSVLELDENVPYGAMPSYDGAEPQKEPNVQYSYSFIRFEPDVNTVTGDITYTAKFSPNLNRYMIKWRNWDGTLLAEEEYEYGDEPLYLGDTPVKDGFEFTGWDIIPTTVTGDMEYTAIFTELDTESETDTSTDSDTETETDTSTDSDTETETDTSADSDTETETDTITDSDTETETDTITDSDTETETDTSTDSDTETETDTSTDSDTETATDTSTDSDTETETDAITDSDTDNEEPVVGDINDDGDIDSSDALFILRLSIGVEEISDELLIYADVNGDGDVDSADALIVIRYSVGIIDNDIVGMLAKRNQQEGL